MLIIYERIRDKMDNRIYDNIFRTLCEKNPKLLIPLINEIFSKSYRMDEDVELLAGEHHTPDMAEEGAAEVITDSCIKICSKFYHIECQSRTDGSMVIRMIEYDFHIALEHLKGEDGKYRMQFPYSAVLYLRHTSRTPDVITMDIVFPDGQQVGYNVPVIKVQNYSDTDIVGKKLYFLTPYYAMRYEKCRDTKEFSKMGRELKRILEGMEDSYTKKEVSGYDIANILEYTRKISDWVFSKNESARKEVDKIMGGIVLETYADKRYAQGKREGKKEGKEEGREEGLELAIRLSQDGRIEDMHRVRTDHAYQNKLLKEYGIIKNQTS